MEHRLSLVVLALLFFGVGTAGYCDDEVDNPWPREIQTKKGTVVMYQPQPESLEGNIVTARSALAVELNDAEAPIFGVVWFKSRLDTDRDERTATLVDITVTQTRLQEQDEALADQLKILLESEIPKWGLTISMDRLLASLELRDQQIRTSNQISTDAPVILFEPDPAVLILIDGEPRLKQEGGSKLMRVINTPFTILLDSKTYYLNADAKTWYSASDLKGSWTVATLVPKEVAALAPQPEESDDEDSDEEPGPPPKIIVATEPTELISSSGAPEYTPISGTELLYMSNTDSDVFLHLSNQQHYVLLAGRWYSANSMDGPWNYVAGEELPDDFAAIPEDSQMGTVLYAVPGTDLAIEAVLDAQIPQTATIERDKASLDVEYDGKPQFEAIEETTMSYAKNSPTPVIRTGTSYYAVDDAVWFVSSNATGPWVVATSVPDIIYTIPPTSPMYNVTYVRIYDYTPDVVYVGYSPGYTGTYVYNTTVVYGTGYYYPYWYGSYYYPRPATWGFHVRYNPYTGWNFGLSYSNGPFTFYIGRGSWYGGGFWGPSRYHGYRHAYRHGYRHGARAGYRAGYRAGQRNSGKQNMYNNQRNKARSTQQSPARNKASAAPSTGRANNVYSDRDGNVHRRNDQGGWEQKTKNGWEGSSQRSQMQTAQRPTSQPSSDNRSTSQIRTQQTKPTTTRQPTQSSYGGANKSTSQQLNHSYNNRQHGSQRTSNYNRSRGASRGGRRR